MNKVARRLPFVALLMICSALIFSGTVLASPDYYYSHPTANALLNLTVTFPTRTYDSVNTTYAITGFGRSSGYGGPGWFEVQLFDGSRPLGSVISSVDVTIGYRAMGATGDATYQISYWVDPSATETVLKGPTGASFNGNETYTGITDPNGGGWNWQDIRNLRVRFTTADSGRSDSGILYIHEIWLRINYAPVRLYVDPPTQTVTASFNVNVSATNVNGLYGMEFKLYYNTTLLTATSVTEGPFLGTGGKSTYFYVKEINDTYSASQGRVWATGTIVGNTPGQAGSGILATVNFDLDGPGGTTTLDLQDTKLSGYYYVDAVTLGTLFSVVHTAYDGTVTVTGAVPEFPLGFALEIALIPLIAYVVLKSRRKTKMSSSYPTSTKL